MERPYRNALATCGRAKHTSAPAATFNSA
jgi:hypothetical protein